MLNIYMIGVLVVAILLGVIEDRRAFAFEAHEILIIALGWPVLVPYIAGLAAGRYFIKLKDKFF